MPLWNQDLLSNESLMTSKQIGFFTKNITLWIQVAIKANLCILGTALGPFLLYKIWRKHKKKEELREKIGQLQDEIGELRDENDNLRKINGALQDEIARRKAQFKKAWRDAPLYPDWRKEEFKAANVTLDEATAHPALLVSERGRRVTWQETCQDLPSSTQRFNSIPCVLGQLRINSGRACWEVEVGDMQSWDLGICRDNVTRKGAFIMSPQNGFWAIRLYDGDYWALTSPETSLPLRERPLKVGIFLDYEAGDVSFYNMTDGSHIFTFPQNTFYGVLRPLFRLWSSDSGSLNICSAEGECTDVIHKSTLQAK